MRNYLVIILALLLSKLAQAHSFDERYDLPIPLEFFLVGSGLVIAASFLLIIVASKYWPRLKLPIYYRIFSITPKWAAAILFLGRLLGLISFILVIAAGFWGPDNPLLNLAPNFIWITWWLGFSLSIALLGNFWPIFNPWASLFDVLIWLSRKLGLKISSEKGSFRFPQWLGLYLATGFLLAWSWMEVVYPIAFVPAKVASIALAWTVINLAGMYAFGKDAWQARGDVFSVYFGTLGQFGMFSFNKVDHGFDVHLPGVGILANAETWRNTRGATAFIIAMLSIVLFDGLHGSQAWGFFVALVQALGLTQLSLSSYGMGTTGLLLVWLIFTGLFYASCWLSSRLITVPATQLSNFFAATLIPIAVAYLIAHNFSSLVIQGQSIIFLASDPLGFGWDIFSTANFRPNIGLIDAKITWYLAVFSIVVGHMIALILNHCLAMRLVSSTKKAALLTIPQAVLMIMFTMLSLVIIAEPMTTSEFSLIDICFSKEAP
jgi:hypothetical protein